MASATKKRASGSSSSTQSPSQARVAYLVVYNLTQALAWSYLLYQCLSHLSKPPPPASLLPSETFSLSTKLQLLSSSAYAKFGKQVTIVQTAAVLDVIHIVFGLVRSKLGTTVAQVSSRLFLVWGILFLFPATQASPFFLPMVMAWCLAEIVRYLNYATALLNISIPLLETLRYSLFYVLYPVGAGSEDIHMWAALPWAEAKYGPPAKWALLFLAAIVWPVSLFFLMSYMHGQRCKHLKSKKTKSA